MKRFSPIMTDEQKVVMASDNSHGEYVKYEDAAQLQQDNEDLRHDLNRSMSATVGEATAYDKCLQQKQEMLKMLKVAQCPDAPLCVDGVIPYQIGDNEWGPRQCQWCYERDALITKIERNSEAEGK